LTHEVPDAHHSESAEILNSVSMATKTDDVAIRYWLTFSSKDIQRPLLWEMSHTFDVIYDIRSASVGPDIGLVGVELSGQAKVIEAAVAWLGKQGVQVDPVF
jgi:ABC-type methionine transport system ATPase subunit